MKEAMKYLEVGPDFELGSESHFIASSLVDPDSLPQLVCPSIGDADPDPSPSISLCVNPLLLDPLPQLVCPSIGDANVFFFSSSFQVQVRVEENEPEEKLVGRFHREVFKAGVLQECKRRQRFESN